MSAMTGDNAMEIKHKKRKQRAASSTAKHNGGDDLDDFGLEIPDWVETSHEANEEDLKGDTKGGATQADDEQQKPKRRKMKKAEKVTFSTQADHIMEADSSEQIEWLWKSYAASTGATDLEREGFEESVLKRLDPSLPLEQQLYKIKAKWKKLLYEGDSVEHGAPVIIFISSSAAQANKIIKYLPTMNKSCRVAKLFAKHFKVEEQQQVLAGQHVNIATGTPNRLCKLVDLGSLKLNRVQLVILDAGKDAKQRTLLDIPEVCKDLWQFLGRHVKPRLASGSANLALIDWKKLRP